MQHPIFLAAAKTAVRTPPLHVVLGVAFPTVGVLAFCGAILLMIKRSEAKRTQAGLMFVAGLGIAGTTGLVRDHIEEWLDAAGRSISAWAFGVVVSYLVGFILVFWLVLDMDLDGLVHKMRKSRKGSGRYTANWFTPWLALLTAGVVASVPYIGRVLSTVTGGAV